MAPSSESSLSMSMSEWSLSVNGGMLHSKLTWFRKMGCFILSGHSRTHSLLNGAHMCSNITIQEEMLHGASYKAIPES